MSARGESNKAKAINMGSITESQFTNDPYAHLAAAIIIKAFEDLTALDGDDRIYFEKSPVTKEGILTFLCSKWCSCLLSFQNTVTQNDIVQAALKIC